jgi:hypothetical protein
MIYEVCASQTQKGELLQKKNSSDRWGPPNRPALNFANFVQKIQASRNY